MVRRKYIKDYRLAETVDEHGRIRTEYEYIGADYRYARGLETALRERRTALIACAGGVLAFLGGLLPRSAASLTLYVALPYIFTTLPLGIVLELLLNREGWAEPFQHSHGDRMENRYPAACLAWEVLPGASLVGELVCLFLKRSAMTWGDAVFALCALILGAAGGCAFSRRGAFTPEKG